MNEAEENPTNERNSLENYSLCVKKLDTLSSMSVSASTDVDNQISLSEVSSASFLFWLAGSNAFLAKTGFPEAEGGSSCRDRLGIRMGYRL